MNLRLLPFGVLMGQAPGAEAIASADGRSLRTPALDLAQRPSVVRRGTFRVDASGAAEIEADAELLGFYGFLTKEQVRNTPAQSRQLAINRIAAQLIPGFEVREFAMPGLDSDAQPLGVAVEGSVRSFVDSAGARAACNSPVPALRMRARFAGQGERKLPFFMNEPLVDHSVATLVLPPGQSFVDVPADLELECPGGSYSFQVRQTADDTWVVERRVLIDAFVIEAAEYAQFIEFCARIDQTESARLFVQKS